MAISAGAAGLMALGSMAGAGIGAAASNASAFKQYKYQKKLQAHSAKLNYEYGLESLRNSPKATRSGLEKAGYNPLLAVQNSTAGANAGWTGTGNSVSPDYNSGITQGIANAVDFKRLANETATAETQQHLNDSTAEAQEAIARKNTADAASQEIANKYMDHRQRTEIGKLIAETANIDRATEHYEAIEHNMEVMQRLNEMGINLDYSAKLYGADKAYNASTYGKDIELAPQKRYNEWAEKHPYLASFDETAKRHLGSIIGAGVGFAGGRYSKIKDSAKEFIKSKTPYRHRHNYWSID